MSNDIDKALAILTATAWQISPENRRGRKYRLRHKRKSRPLTQSQRIVKEAIAFLEGYQARKVVAA